MTETHHHEWTEDPTNPRHWACDTCADHTTSCSQCSCPLDTSLLVCNPCLERARRIPLDLHEWMQAYDFGVQLINIRAIRYDRDKVTSSNDDARLPFGLDQITDDPEDTRIGAIKTPDRAVAILEDWARAWAETLHDPAPGNALSYLAEHTLWAVQNPDLSAWDIYLDEARQVRSAVRRLLGIAPVPEPVPCVHCGGRIVREWTEDGLDDTRRCQSCGMEWANGGRLDHTNALVLHQLPTTHPDTLVTTEQARRIYPQLHPATLRKWVHRGHIEAQEHDVRGMPMYRLSDIAERVNPSNQATA